MSFWVEIKKAINSTLGTKEFEPLDKRFDRLLAEQYILESSDDVFYSFDNEEHEDVNDFDITQGFVATRGGTLTVKTTITSNKALGYTITAYANGEEIATKTLTKSVGSAVTVSLPITFNYGDKITFHVDMKYGGGYSKGTHKLSNFAMYGTIKIKGVEPTKVGV